MGVGERLRYARERAGLSLSQVKERAGIGESSVSEFEGEKREPKLAQLRAFAKTYQRSISFFLSEGPIPRETVLWRERPRENAEGIETRFLQLCEQYHNLEVWCNEPRRSDLPEPEDEVEGFGYDKAEALANRVNRELLLGDRPGQALLRVLEEACGVKVFHLDFEPSGAAASTKSKVFGYAVLLNSVNVRWRRSFDLAHELFHLLTWNIFRSVDEEAPFIPGEREEKLATCFARHLLMPMAATREAVGRRARDGKLTYEALFDIAREFDVSVEALLRHMHFVYGRGPGDHEKTEREIKAANALAPVLAEREDSKPPKWPERYQSLAITALRRGEISTGRFAEYLGMSRRRAMKYVERESEIDEGEIEISPA